MKRGDVMEPTDLPNSNVFDAIFHRYTSDLYAGFREWLEYLVIRIGSNLLRDPMRTCGSLMTSRIKVLTLDIKIRSPYV